MWKRELRANPIPLRRLLEPVLSKQNELGRRRLEKSFNGRMQVDIRVEGGSSRWMTLRFVRTPKKVYPKEMSVPEKVDIAANLERVRERMADAACRAGRSQEEITLVAVTKTIEPAIIKEVVELGVRDLGENRVQEAEWKIPLLPEVTWHMIGHLQRNKVKKALLLFDMMHSVDSLRLAQEIDRRASRIGARVPVLLEVNLSGEATKYGFRMAPRVTQGGEKEAFFSYVEEILRLPCLEVRGLMTMAPLVAQPEEARPYFQRLRGLREELKERFPQACWEDLSMGMTDDFEVAIEEGATMVRVGRAIFGERRE